MNSAADPQPQAEDAQPAAEATSEAAPAAGLLDQVIGATRARSDTERSRNKDLIQEFISQLVSAEMTVSKDTVATINARIAQMDALISSQLNEIMHNPEFQKLESSWRGLNYLVMNSETGTGLKIRVFNVSKSDLLKDAQKAPEFDQSTLFKKVYEEEYGTPGGAPYGALIGDFEFGRHPQDLELIEELSHVAAAAHAPFISAAAPEMFGFDSYTELSNPRDLAKIFEAKDMIKWRSFRESEDSRYVGLTLPRTLSRLPYGPETVPVEEFNFMEDVDGKDHSKYLWQNAAYAFGTRLTDAFAKYGWCAAIRGTEGGGRVDGLPTHTFLTDEGELDAKCPTEIAITDRREKELADLGFMPISHYKNTDYAVFFGAQSAQKAKKYDTDEANANARLSTQLQYIMATSRFAHYLKVINRDKIGSFMSREECEKFLNRWISNYVLATDSASQAEKSKRPLREARVVVSEDPAAPGVYSAAVFLRPHFQLDELTVSLRLVAKLPESVA